MSKQVKQASGCTGPSSCWPPLDEIDGETEQLVSLVETGWDWQFPGWQDIADSLNSEYDNDRSAEACRSKYRRIISKANAHADRPAKAGERGES